MDNRAKAQAHITRAQMYLGSDNTKSRLSFGKIDDDIAKLQRYVDRRKEKINDATTLIGKATQSLAASGRKYEHRSEKEDNVAMLLKYSIELSEQLSAELLRQSLPTNATECQNLTGAFTANWSGGHNKAAALCNLYQKRTELDPKKVIETVMDTTKLDKPGSLYRAWSLAEAAVIKRATENTGEKRESSFSSLQKKGKSFDQLVEALRPVVLKKASADDRAKAIVAIATIIHGVLINAHTLKYAKS